eukprot:1157263-Pelagomonas_calceolata.AAC.13
MEGRINQGIHHNICQNIPSIKTPWEPSLGVLLTQVMEGSISWGTKQSLLIALFIDAPNDLVMDGSISRGSTIESYASREKWEVQELGILAPNRRPQQTLYTGQVGYVITGIKASFCD